MSEVESPTAKIGALVGLIVTVTLIGTFYFMTTHFFYLHIYDLALTASLPLNLPRHQTDKITGIPDTTVVDSNADIAWTISSCIFFFLLPTATTYLYGITINNFNFNFV